MSTSFKACQYTCSIDRVHTGLKRDISLGITFRSILTIQIVWINVFVLNAVLDNV